LKDPEDVLFGLFFSRINLLEKVWGQFFNFKLGAAQRLEAILQVLG